MISTTNRSFLLSLVVVFGLSAPVVAVEPKKVIEPRAYPAADPAEYAPFKLNGKGVIEGQAFLRQRGGGLVTAAGSIVYLVPFTSLSKEWFFRDLMEATTPVRFSPEGRDIYRTVEPSFPADPLFQNTLRTATADAQGKFNFAKLPPGRYWLRTHVTWMVGGEEQGGMVADWVVIDDTHEKVTIVLTDRQLRRWPSE